ncbi:beta-mannosidase [Tangfeifania diversioriginum]|uniref:beta-mannosidase n=1 Tax=Tangfeifania diversioriginum TaxID=1168035 RepID=A0A1M6E380_9BACT|nr:glycoside hydrolase family 2 TIM barrel-domain containing protein [Tangfeifania diversioriginum]SHI79901.1 beta-mannosidase [Tangfeifania diversioriginum]
MYRNKFLILFLLLTISVNNQIYGINAGQLKWKLWGYLPNTWRMNFDFNQLSGTWAEYSAIPFTVPGSVQNALKAQGIVPDWNIGLNFTKLEWIENRHWIIATSIPDDWVTEKDNCILHCKGLDHQGILFINGQEAGRFNNAFIPWSFDISPFLKEKNNTLAFVFKCPPNYLGQIGYTSQTTDWKPRFYYGWDWVPRIVQIGIWDEILLQTKSQNILSKVQVETKAEKEKDEGELSVLVEDSKSSDTSFARISLNDSEGELIFKDSLSMQEISFGKTWKNLKIKRWYPNGWGNQNLYLLKITFYEANGQSILTKKQKVGFKHLEWLSNKGAPENADSWICSVNNQPLFIQGVNWTPLLPNFADLKKMDYKKILNTYKILGINTIRIWGGGFAEKSWLYELCDELGILIWQDFPLSSSGLDNYPPSDPETIAEFTEIAKHYVTRLKNHVSLLLWCGGNELYEKDDVRPVDNSHPLIAAIEKTVNNNDPDRRFLPGSPSGPSIYASPANFGKGVHWDTHGPWKLPFGEKKTMDEVTEFWKKNDSFFFSEVGVPGAMQASLIGKYSGDFRPLPASLDNPLWRTVNWWNEWNEYLVATSENERSLENYVRWSQSRQAEGLEIAVKSSKEKFPECGGFLIWMGHDCFPCMINTAIIDFEGNPKPVAERLSKIWKNNDKIIYSQ